MAGVVEGACLGAMCQEAAKLFTGQVTKALKFKSTREKLESTEEHVLNVVNKMKQLDEKLDRPKEETETPMEKVKESKKLRRKLSKVPFWKCCCLSCYQAELQAMQENLERSLTRVSQLRGERNVDEILETVKSFGEKQLQFKDLCKPPEKPDLTVGLDRPLNELRIELLKSGASVTVITGLAGSGKSTLATLLCHDEQVRGQFQENILFVTVSKTPNLKIIVQTVFQYCKRDVPALVNDEHAVRVLKGLLREIGENPMMLVLDDVWPGSESLVEAFQVQLTYYKILVTSRVEFPRFGTSCQLKPLCQEDAVTLFRHFALLNDGISYIPGTDSIQKVATGCWGSPLALKLIGGSLRGQRFEVWQKMKKLLSNSNGRFIDNNVDLRDRLLNWFDYVLEDKSIVKECFMDLGLFPEGQKIPVVALIDMWTELYKQDDEGIDSMIKVNELTKLHLVDLVVTREVAKDEDMNYNNHFLKQHDLLRELAIFLCNQEPFEQRERVIIDLIGNHPPEWCARQNPQRTNSCMQPFFPLCWMGHRQKRVSARTLCISTDASDWCNMQPDETEVLVFINIRSRNYALPKFTKKMKKLKVMILANYCFDLSEVNKFELLGYLPHLKRIRLEKVSVPYLCKLRSLQKLSLHMCNTKQAFEISHILISDALPNLVEMNIDYCKDLVKLPSDICNIITMKKLSITNCHNLSALPKEIGKLVNLEVLRLSACSDLQEMPESVGRLHKLRFLDISECISLTQLPVNIGDMHSLEKLYMWGCSSELPCSINFEDLKHKICVTCDDETAALWEHFTDLPNLKIGVYKEDVNLNWLPDARSSH